ncbi:hypothetical protein GCM10027018_21580 [Paenibacillus thermoaerophilus]
MKVCQVEGCNKPVKAKQLCSAHHQRMLRNGHPTASRPRVKKEPKPCQWPKCERHAVAKGLCSKHYYLHRIQLKVAEREPAVAGSERTAEQPV